MKPLIDMTDAELREERNRLFSLPAPELALNMERIKTIDFILKERDEYDAISEFHGG